MRGDLPPELPSHAARNVQPSQSLERAYVLSSGNFDLVHQFRSEVASNEAWEGHLGDQFDGCRKLSLMTMTLPHYSPYASFVLGRRERWLEIAWQTTSPSARHSP
jgi:hypothetical protein